MFKRIGTIFLALFCSSQSFAYEFELENQPHVFIAGDVVGLIGEEGYHYLFDAPPPRVIPAEPHRPVRFELTYQSRTDREIALSKSESSFLVTLKIHIGEDEYQVDRFRIPVVRSDDSDFISMLSRLELFLYDLTTTAPIEDLFDQVTLMQGFLSSQRVLAFGGARDIFDDVLARMPKFTKAALESDDQLWRNVWATHMLNMTEMTTTCASAVAFPTPHSRPRGTTASEN